MNGQLSIEHLAGSSLAGMKQDYSGPTVSIGTSPASHICFDEEDDPNVVAKHAKLTLDASGVRVQALDKEAGVLLNDGPVDGSAPVKSGDILTLGEDGPKLKVTINSLPNADAPARTVMGGGAPGEPGVPKRKPGGNQASKAPMPGGLAPTVVGKRQPKGAPGQPPPVRVDLGVPAAPSEPASKWKSGRKPRGDSGPGSDGYTPSDQQKTTVGMNTLMGVVNRATKKERGRMMFLLVGVVVLLVGGGLTAAVVFWPDDPPPQVTNNTTVQTKSFEWSTVAEEVKPSVCLAMQRRPGTTGSEMAFGTVWSVGEGVFATNAHVAEVFEDEGTFGVRPEIIIRTPGAEPKDLRVKSILLHPGYRKWEELIKEYNPYIPGMLDFLASNSFTPCDVALMYIEEADIPNQPPYLTLVEDATNVGEGTSLASFGYSQEGVKLNTQRPTPEGRFGSLVKTADTFLASAGAEEAAFYWYDWTIAGGASGSPVFNKQGEVVSLISAANMVGAINNVRIPSGGTSVGPHVRYVKELLSGEYPAAQAARTEAWEADLLRQYVEGTSHIEDLTLKQAFTVMDIFSAAGFFDANKQYRPMLNAQAEAVLTVRNGTGSVVAPAMQVGQGSLIIIATAVDRPIQITGYRDGAPPAESPGYSNYFWTLIEQNNDQGLRLKVAAKPDSPDGTTKVAIYAFQIQIVE